MMANQSVAPVFAGKPCPVYVISLPGDERRRDSITRQMTALGVDFTFVDGVRGSALSADEYRAMVAPADEIRRHLGRDIGPGEVGCSLSHQKVYDMILAAGHSHACVLEDDALLLPGFTEVLASVSELDMDMLLIGYSNRAQEEVRLAWLYDPIVPLGSVGHDHVHGLRPRHGHLGTVAYVVSHQGCRLLKANFPVKTVADDYPYFSSFMRIGHLRPQVVMEDNSHHSTVRESLRRNRGGLGWRQSVSRGLRGLLRHAHVLWVRWLFIFKRAGS